MTCSSCTTCNLNYTGCPGHPGHIDLPVPVYHPILMDQLLRLLRAKCAYCHYLRMSRKEVNRYLCKLRLIQHGLLSAAELVDNLEVPMEKKDGTPVPNECENESPAESVIRARNRFVKKSLKMYKISSNNLGSEKNEGISAARRMEIKSFLKSITVGRTCGNCNGISPTFRKDRFVKIFEKPLSLKDAAKMTQGNFKSQNAVELVGGDKNDIKFSDFDEGIADLDLSSDDTAKKHQNKGGTSEVNNNVLSPEPIANPSSGSKPMPAHMTQRFVNAMEVRAQMQLLFEKDQDILKLVYNSRATSRKVTDVSPDMFFIQTLLVPSNKYRPESRADGQISEAEQNSLYKAIIRNSEQISLISQDIQNPEIQSSYRKRDFYDLQEAWCILQESVNSLIDRDRNPIQGAAGRKIEDGIKQKLEKKEGLFRKNMMGKRVNFAARSVISPDPNIETNEIGVPPVFAKKLTYPEPVTSYNFKDLQQAVINGPNIWPGATAIENNNGQVINLRFKTPDERLALANQLLTDAPNCISGARNKKVYRHLANGDVVLMNRQPTLHKPSIMGHRARILPGEKTIRMHYANCNTYNADFDGDEMNMHFPQNEIARAEALQIADTDHQYLSATSGKPLRGLIQDHISISVWMCNRDTFFDKDTYQQLIYSCLWPENGHIIGDRIVIVPPAIMKPVQRWTGKQIITTILKNITPIDCAPVSLNSKSQTPLDRWGPNSEEGAVQFITGEFITGILDKSQIGPSSGGFIHSIHEVYGPVVAGKMIGILGRVLTKFLHMRAFSCGLDDLRLTPQGERIRKQKIEMIHHIGLEVAAKYVTLTESLPNERDSELISRLQDVLRDDIKQAGLDMMMNKRSGELSSEITIACLPTGLAKQFPKNQMQTMTVSGAKGSAVNANLISCNLGQQVLEGRRVPVMVSGKTLPCFSAYDTHVRAGGYIKDRFLTGIRPQEYYFHAMAGREGLIDTAVKTSRSGYLQRCLIKGMEGLRVEYDTSVRDSDGSIIQFLYGEDGLDVTKQTYLTDFRFILQNIMSELSKLNYGDPKYNTIFDEKDLILKRMKKATKYAKAHNTNGPDPVLTDFNPGKFGYATSEKFFDALTNYLKSNPDGLVKDKQHPNGVGVRKALEPVLAAKYLRSVVEPGEAVGIVAGQSVGEPSTQMTLNTFHLAGHSAKNVTLGIPRLREIIMTASSKISTPTMTLRVNPEVSKIDGENFAKSISVLSLSQILDEVTVKECIGPGVNYPEARIYDVCVKLFPSKEYIETHAISVSDVLSTFENKFTPRLQSLTRKALRNRKKPNASSISAVPDISKSVGIIEQATGVVDQEDVADEEGDGDATNEKIKAYQSEAATYAANDEEDDRVQIEMQEGAEPTAEDYEDEGIDVLPPNSASDDEQSDDISAKEHNPAFKEREYNVMNICKDVVRFKFDEVAGEWCEITLEYNADVTKVLMLSIVEKALRESLIQQIPGLEICTYEPDVKIKNVETNEFFTAPIIHATGVNIKAMQMYPHIINPHVISTNDISSILQHYGVEACRAAIIRELSDVFAGHSISVDHRHLNLIADFMTRGGGFTPFNRNGMRENVSPFMKMSFETTVGFLVEAVCDGDWDDLSNPSSRLVIGKMSKTGTGAFDVFTRVPTCKSTEIVA